MVNYNVSLVSALEKKVSLLSVVLSSCDFSVSVEAVYDLCTLPDSSFSLASEGDVSIGQYPSVGSISALKRLIISLNSLVLNVGSIQPPTLPEEAAVAVLCWLKVSVIAQDFPEIFNIFLP